MVIDGVAASQVLDSSAEVVEIAGIDCAQFDEDGGILLNWEHEPGEKGASTIVGKVLYLKKIFKASDCTDDRQKKYWQKTAETPYIYVICRLFDGSDHYQAQHLAAIIRDNDAHDEPIAPRFSIEGLTTKRDGNTVKGSIFRQLAVTVKPCNKTAISGLLADNARPLKKSAKDISPIVFDSHRLIQGIATLHAFALLKKNEVAPSQLTGFAALAREWLDRGSNLHENEEEFLKFAKSRLGELSPTFLEHFAQAKGTLSAKTTPLDRISKATNLIKSQILELKQAKLATPPDVRTLAIELKGKTTVLGRILLQDGLLHHLEDDFGYLETKIPEGICTGATRLFLDDIAEGPRFVYLASKKPLELKPQVTKDNLPGVFTYSREGAEPGTVEFGSNGVSFNGHQVSDVELERILANVNAGLATLAYKTQKSVPTGLLRNPKTGTLNHYALKQASAPVWVAFYINNSQDVLEQKETMDGLATSLVSKFPDIYRDQKWFFLGLDKTDRALGQVRLIRDFLSQFPGIQGIPVVGQIGLGISPLSAQVAAGKCPVPEGLPREHKTQCWSDLPDLNGWIDLDSGHDFTQHLPAAGEPKQEDFGDGDSSGEAAESAKKPKDLKDK